MENNSNTPRILVGVDGSGSSIVALHAAARIATAMNAHIQAIIAWEYPAMFFPVPNWSPGNDAKLILSTAIKQAFGDEPPADLDSKVLCGYAATVLIEQSKFADMLVLGSRGHGGFAGLLLGSVSAVCAQHSHCPVLIAHGGDSSKLTGSMHEASFANKAG